jgi:DNA invertase Pin-like site-specific DNA recombinase
MDLPNDSTSTKSVRIESEVKMMAEPILAAEYVRMSTDQQQYSLDNQSDVIRRYADHNNMRIVRTYSDAGRTGLTLASRPALRKLIEDVESGQPGFSAVLVYDVSRWGRFQDADESAYYEYRCRRAQITVHYYAEPFPNDGSIMSVLIKALKRAMAAEYSRELSVKVFAGKARLTELGFRQGGMAGYGFRRLLVNQRREPKFMLDVGEAKSIETDRVILVPGPPNEIAIVREVFDRYANKRLSPVEIATTLNGRGVPWMFGRPWTRYVIRDMVTNPKYVGDNVSNRRSGKLRSPRRWNPPDMWIRRENAFEGLVDPDLYRRAESIAAARSRPHTNDELLQLLRAFLKRHRHATARTIDADPAMPCVQVYRERFGGLTEAYRRVGYTVSRDMSYIERDRNLRDMRRDFSTRVADELCRLKATTAYDWQSKTLIVNDSLTVRMVVTRCRSLGESHGWLLRLGSAWKPDVTVIGRLAVGNSDFMDYFLLRPRNMRGLTQVTLRSDESSAFEECRYDDLSFLTNVVRWSKSRKRGS